MCGDGAGGVSGFVSFEDVEAFEGVGVGVEGGGAEESTLAVFGEGDGVDGEFVVSGGFVSSDEEGRDSGDDELLVDELEGSRLLDIWEKVNPIAPTMTIPRRKL